MDKTREMGQPLEWTRPGLVHQGTSLPSIRVHFPHFFSFLSAITILYSIRPTETSLSLSLSLSISLSLSLMHTHTLTHTHTQTQETQWLAWISFFWTAIILALLVCSVSTCMLVVCVCVCVVWGGVWCRAIVCVFVFEYPVRIFVCAWRFTQFKFSCNTHDNVHRVCSIYKVWERVYLHIKHTRTYTHNRTQVTRTHLTRTKACHTTN